MTVIYKTPAPRGTTLRDVIQMLAITHPKFEPPYAVQYRIQVPEFNIDDTLAGYCKWDGEELTSLDGDNYSLDDEIVAYEVFENLKRKSILAVVVDD